MFKPNCVLALLSPEISLKSNAVQKRFHLMLKDNIKLDIKNAGAKYLNIYYRTGRFFIDTTEPEKVINALKNTFGLYQLIEVQKEKIFVKEEIMSYGLDLCLDFKGSFAIRCKSRGNPLNSMEVERELGAEVVAKKNLKVNLTNPDNQLNILIFNDKTYFYFKGINGAKGMPVGVQGKVALFGENKQLTFYLNKFGCTVVNVDKNNLESIEKAKKLYRETKVKAFFCEAKTIKERKEFDKLAGIKVFAPLII